MVNTALGGRSVGNPHAGRGRRKVKEQMDPSRHSLHFCPKMIWQCPVGPMI
jgi:hypothetical protein